MNISKVALGVFLCMGSAAVAAAPLQDSTQEELQQLMQQLEALQEKVKALEAKVAEQQQPVLEEKEVKIVRESVQNETLVTRVEALEERVEENKNAPIQIGGAVRVQYVWEDYNEGQRDRGGDFDFDLLRIDYRGEIGDVILSAQYRWFQYMDVVQQAWVGYNFTDEWQGQVGVTTVPFGNTPYNSNSYFFSSNFYVGLEDDHDMGIKMLYRTDDWDFDFAFFKSDEMGGADGYVSSKSDRYAYDPVGVRLSGEGIYDDPIALAAESNSWAFRGARKFSLGAESSAELGASLQFGDMNNGVDNIGDRYAWAVHGLYSFDRWAFKGQITQYNYDLDLVEEGIIVGAYAFYDTIPSKANLYTASAAYSLPVQWGPVTNLTFYNDFSLMTNKRFYTEDTLMNVLGMAVSAGGLYTYFDIVTARNQPFIGGSMIGESKDTSTRFNVNIGYYF